MPRKISLYTVQDRERFGLPDTVSGLPDTVSEPNLRQSHREVGRSLSLIMDFVCMSDGVTRLEIATHLKRKKTPHLIQQIEHLVDLGLLIKTCEPHEGITGIQYTYRSAE